MLPTGYRAIEARVRICRLEDNVIVGPANLSVRLQLVNDAIGSGVRSSDVRQYSNGRTEPAALSWGKLSNQVTQRAIDVGLVEGDPCITKIFEVFDHSSRKSLEVHYRSVAKKTACQFKPYWIGEMMQRDQRLDSTPMQSAEHLAVALDCSLVEEIGR